MVMHDKCVYFSCWEDKNVFTQALTSDFEIESQSSQGSPLNIWFQFLVWLVLVKVQM